MMREGTGTIKASPEYLDLYVNKKYQDHIDPLVVSWGYKSETPTHSQFQDNHLWQGTRDFSSFLTISVTLPT